MKLNSDALKSFVYFTQISFYLLHQDVHIILYPSQLLFAFFSTIYAYSIIHRQLAHFFAFSTIFFYFFRIFVYFLTHFRLFHEDFPCFFRQFARICSFSGFIFQNIALFCFKTTENICCYESNKTNVPLSQTIITYFYTKISKQ